VGFAPFEEIQRDAVDELNGVVEEGTDEVAEKVERKVPHQEEKRRRRKYCRKYIGLRLVIEHQSDSEIDSWHALSRFVNRPSEDKPIKQMVINLRIMVSNKEKKFSGKYQINLDDSMR